MGKRPANAACAPPRSARVAFHPGALVLAVGYEDGCMLLVRLKDAAELLVRPAAEG